MDDADDTDKTQITQITQIDTDLKRSGASGGSITCCNNMDHGPQK